MRMVCPFSPAHPLAQVHLASLAEYHNLPRNSWGIKEYPSSFQHSIPLNNEDNVDLVLVPGVAFDRMGNRLGHGRVSLSPTRLPPSRDTMIGGYDPCQGARLSLPWPWTARLWKRSPWQRTAGTCLSTRSLPLQLASPGLCKH